MTRYTCKDISIFFQSSCCNKQIESSNFSKKSPCPNSAKIGRSAYIKKMADDSITMHATTITIGNKWLGKKSAKDQYEVFVKRIKQHIPYHSSNKYLYHFELQNNGQLHAHGIEIGTYRAAFIESFGDFGMRNRHGEAFTKIKSLDKYILYMDKSNDFLPISNIKKSEYKCFLPLKGKGLPKGIAIPV